jgi:hypothetical protein
MNHGTPPSVLLDALGWRIWEDAVSLTIPVCLALALLASSTFYYVSPA